MPAKFENASYVFCPCYAEGIWKCNNRRSIVSEENPSFFLKRSSFKMFSIHTKTQCQSFQIPLICRAFSKNYIFVMDKCGW